MTANWMQLAMAARDARACGEACYAEALERLRDSAQAALDELGWPPEEGSPAPVEEKAAGYVPESWRSGV